VSAFLGVKGGDSTEKVGTLLQEDPFTDNARQWREKLDHNRFYHLPDGSQVVVHFYNFRALSVALLSRVRPEILSRLYGRDQIYNLYGRSERDVIAALGRPSARWDSTTPGIFGLDWYFPGKNPKLNSDPGRIRDEATRYDLYIQFQNGSAKYITVKW
jgi:hypothetical protein